MGGPGSGAWYRWDKRTTLDQVQRVDVRALCRAGAEVGQQAVLEYGYRQPGGEWEQVQQPVALSQTRCHFGGMRWWFLCPICRRRVAVLYRYGKWFRCRHCCQLPYSSQCETALDRAYRKVRKIRSRLGVSGNLNLPIHTWHKPKGMHWRTFERLCGHERDAHTVVLEHLALGLERLLQR